MCGIAGYHSLLRSPSKQPTPDLVAMTRSLAHRGPDDEGFLEIPGTGLGMRRLSVIDLETGGQPISNETDQVSVVYNGEIYNYRELRAQLRDRGHDFATASDTEVLVHGYEEWGKDLVHHLRGMFAFAILDQRDPDRQRLFLARDQCGIKPLYYAVVDQMLYFASEIKSILAVSGVSRDLDHNALDSYMALLYIPEPSTIFSEISALPPGSTLSCSKGEIKVNRYWRFEHQSGMFASRREAVERVREVFEDSVKAMLVADVPLGVFLSGGLDSVSILAMMSRQGIGDLKTFSIGFGPDAKQWDELDDAREVAEAFGTDHHEFRVEPSIVELLPQTVRQFDQPFANPTAIILSLLARETRRHVKVALAGTGADELLGGYPRYLGMRLHRRYEHLPRSARRIASAIAGRLLTGGVGGSSTLQRIRRFFEAGSRDFSDAYVRLVSSLHDEQRQTLYSSSFLERVSASGPTDFLRKILDSTDPSLRFDQLLQADVHTYLPFNQLAYGDRMSMAHSLELRVPFVDQRFLEVAAGIPLHWHLRAGTTKAIFRDAMAPYLPQKVIRGRKRGINLPIPLWFRGELRDWMEGLLSPERIERRGFFNPSAVGSLCREHRNGQRDHSLLLWAMVALETWCQQNLGD
jgi:asparagine synthase (glutamine-hydrolysing)